jgi:malate/lactate dehydrogenase
MKISVIGAAGYVGSNVAFTLALFGLADEIVLIDPFKPNMVTHFAMDGNTAVAEKGVLLRAGDYDEMKDSHIVIMAAGAPQGLIASRMEMLPKNLPIIQDIAGKIKKLCPDSIVITATNPVDPLNYAMYRWTGFDRQKIIGYTTNDSTRFRMLVAQALGYSTGDVDGVVLGEHGESQTLLFSSVKIKGKYVKLDDNTKQKVRDEIPHILRRYEELQTGRTAGLTSATGMKRMIEAIVNNSNKVIPCSAVLDGEYGCQNLSMGVPAVLGSGGIHKILELEIAADEKPYLDITLKVLKESVRQVDDYLKNSRSG